MHMQVQRDHMQTRKNSFKEEFILFLAVHFAASGYVFYWGWFRYNNVNLQHV